MSTNSFNIELQGLRFFAFHGVYEEEERTGQEFEVDLSVEYFPQVEKVDQIHETINYVDLFLLVKEEMQHPRKLLETLATEIVEKIRGRFSGLGKIVLRVTKINPAIPNFSGSVSVQYQSTA